MSGNRANTMFDEKLSIFSSKVEDFYLYIKEASQIPNTTNTKKTTPMCIIIKLLIIKCRKKNLKAAKNKKGKITFKGAITILTADFSIEMFKARKQ